ncbi:GGDEF domain-containing protein [Ideonella sp. DXS29W]|uniref:diguanylate cyclase n=1 Tax=Ideonella lacteola TaxID=2984193 RepID=A0ABU9BGZ8_9BURK
MLPPRSRSTLPSPPDEATPPGGGRPAGSAPPASPGELGFAQIVGAVRTRPLAPKATRKKVLAEAVPTPAPPETPAAALERAAAMVRGGQMEAGIALCLQTWPIVSAADDVVQMGICQHMLAIGYQYSGNLKEALTAGHLGIELFTRAADPMRLLRLIAAHAITVAQLGQAAEALELLNRAIQLLPLVGDEPWHQCVFWNNAGAVHQALGQTDQALDAWERCMELNRRHDDPNLAAVTRANLLAYRLVTVRKRQADRVAIQAVYDEHRALLDELVEGGRHHLVLNGAAEAADAMIDMGELDEARAVLKLGVKSAKIAGLGPSRASLELHLARVERLSNQHRLAAAHVAEALKLVQESQDQELLARVHLENSLLQEAQQHWRAALDFFKRHAETREALLAAQADTRAQALAARVDVERSRVDAELARLRNAELQRQVEHMAEVAGELKRQALEDPLTGLANRRQFELHLAQWQAERGVDTPLVLMMGDIDHFKQINDRFSHATGDEVLRDIARLLREHLRPHDAIARWGGEEFVVAFGGGLPMDQAMNVAERLRAMIEQHAWGRVAAGLSVTMSLGLASMGHDETIESALWRADSALYESKKNGRNQVRLAL